MQIKLNITKDKIFKFVCIGTLSVLAFGLVSCGYVVSQSQDSLLAQQQEKNLAEGDRQVAPPAIVNWNEKRMAKLIMEMRDQANLATWTYTKNMDGKYTFVCESVGYGLPYNTRNNNPQHYEFVTTTQGVGSMGSGGGGYYTDNKGRTIWGEHTVMPQAEPNGLFIPDSAKGTWNLCKNPAEDPRIAKAHITYQEEDVSVFPFPLPAGMVEGFHPVPGQKVGDRLSETQIASPK
jgi:hypothetical protein